MARSMNSGNNYSVPNASQEEVFQSANGADPTLIQALLRGHGIDPSVTQQPGFGDDSSMELIEQLLGGNAGVARQMMPPEPQPNIRPQAVDHFDQPPVDPNQTGLEQDPDTRDDEVAPPGNEMEQMMQAASRNSRYTQPYQQTAEGGPFSDMDAVVRLNKGKGKPQSENQMKAGLRKTMGSEKDDPDSNMYSKRKNKGPTKIKAKNLEKKNGKAPVDDYGDE